MARRSDVLFAFGIRRGGAGGRQRAKEDSQAQYNDHPFACMIVGVTHVGRLCNLAPTGLGKMSLVSGWVGCNYSSQGAGGMGAIFVPPPWPFKISLCTTATFVLRFRVWWLCLLSCSQLAASRRKTEGSRRGREEGDTRVSLNSSYPPPSFLHSNIAGGLMSVGCSDSSVQRYESKDKRGGGRLESD